MRTRKSQAVSEFSGPVLIDTSVWLEAIHPRGREDCKALVHELLSADRAATCEIIMAEVLRGAHTQEALERLEEGMGTLVLLPMQGVSAAVGRAALELRSRGVTIPTTDLLIAATAAVNGAALVHRDAHLEPAAQALSVRSWRL